jgi:hypothetical protein
MEDNKKRKPPTKFDLNYITNLCIENNLTLTKTYNTNDNINGKTLLSYFCITPNCNEIFSKQLRNLHINKLFLCHKCTQKNKIEKQTMTNLKIYGVKNVFQSEEIKEKIKEKCLETYGCEYYLQTKEKKEKSEKTCLEKYGVKNPTQSIDIQNKRTQTIYNKYGVVNAFQSEEIKDKIKNTCLEKYGTLYASQSEIVKDKMKETCLEKYGVNTSLESKLVRNKINQTNLEKYGVENPFQSDEIKQKIKETNLEKYGVEYTPQLPEIAEKMSKKAYAKKDYIMPSGNIISCQGYEPFALNDLLQKELVKEEDIITGCKNVPEIWYNDDAGKKHRHFVDIFIPSQNRCIEVKSTWTAKKKQDNIYLKQNAGKELGYNYEIWIYNGKGERVENII